MTIRHDSDEENDVTAATARRFDPSKYSPDLGLKFAYPGEDSLIRSSSKHRSGVTSMISEDTSREISKIENNLTTDDSKENNNNVINETNHSVTPELNDSNNALPNNSKLDAASEESPKFRLQLSSELGDIMEQDESQELTMDYPSLVPLDIKEVKARRRETEAKLFQQELERMSIQLADRLKRIPATSRRSYKKESIYVKDLYTLTYEEGETVESLGYIVRRNDREEIRRRLAMGGEEDTNEGGDRRPSLQSRLQTGMNLQICFMNETASDCESQCSDTESTQDHRIDLPKGSKALHQLKGGVSCNADFRTRQIQLQAEARLALSQAKDMARMQMEVDRQSKRCSPVTEIIRDSFIKIGLTFPDNKRRLSRQMLTDMNVAQLQVIVNHLHSQIESLNEELVRLLLDRDDFHMEQDSRLVDIEDLTNHLAAKERSNSTSSSSSTSKSSSSTASTPSSATLPPSTHTPSPQLVKPPILSSSSK